MVSGYMIRYISGIHINGLILLVVKKRRPALGNGLGRLRVRASRLNGQLSVSLRRVTVSTINMVCSAMPLPMGKQVEAPDRHRQVPDRGLHNEAPCR